MKAPVNFEFETCKGCTTSELCKFDIRMSGSFITRMAAGEAKVVSEGGKEVDKAFNFIGRLHANNEIRMADDAQTFIDRECDFSPEEILALQRQAKDFYQEHGLPQLSE